MPTCGIDDLAPEAPAGAVGVPILPRGPDWATAGAASVRHRTKIAPGRRGVATESSRRRFQYRTVPWTRKRMGGLVRSGAKRDARDAMLPGAQRRSPVPITICSPTMENDLA
jgi:hypothetical protein